MSPSSTKATVAKRTEYKGVKTGRKKDDRKKTRGKDRHKGDRRTSGKAGYKGNRKTGGKVIRKAKRANSWSWRVFRFFFHMLWLPVLLVGALAVGLVIGYTVLGGEPPGDVFSRDLWQYLYDIVNADG